MLLWIKELFLAKKKIHAIISDFCKDVSAKGLKTSSTTSSTISATAYDGSYSRNFINRLQIYIGFYNIPGRF